MAPKKANMARFESFIGGEKLQQREGFEGLVCVKLGRCKSLHAEVL